MPTLQEYHTLVNQSRDLQRAIHFIRGVQKHLHSDLLADALELLQRESNSLRRELDRFPPNQPLQEES